MKSGSWYCTLIVFVEVVTVLLRDGNLSVCLFGCCVKV